MPKSMVMIGGKTLWSSAGASGCFTPRQRPQHINRPGSVLIPTSMRAKEPVGEAEERPDAVREMSRPLLMVDIDGVISLFGGWDRGAWGVQTGVGESGEQVAEGSFHSIEGSPHFLSSAAAAHLLELSAIYELVWASGWEERANEHLPHLLGLPPSLPFLRFSRNVGRTNAHWKLDAIDAFARKRPLAWIDDAFNEACHEWSAARGAPTLLVQTTPTVGLTELETSQLAAWALALARE
jgi:hypothetical protein